MPSLREWVRKLGALDQKVRDASAEQHRLDGIRTLAEMEAAQRTVTEGPGVLVGGALEQVTQLPPSEGLALQSPLVVNKPAGVENAIGKLALRSPFVPHGTPGAMNVFPPVGEKKVQLGNTQISLLKDAPPPIALAMAFAIPGPEDVPRIAGEVGRARKAAKVVEDISEAAGIERRGSFIRKVLGNVELPNKEFGRTRIVKSSGELVGAPVNPITGKRIRLTKKEVLDLRRKGQIEIDPKGQWYLKSGAQPGQLSTFEDYVSDLVKEGANGRYWYELSGQELMAMTGGNVDDATRLAGLLAIYSQGTSVQANATNALRAWNRFKLGEPVYKEGTILGRFSSMDQRAHEFLYENKAWEGMKTNAFFVNLLRDIDPVMFDHLKQGVTVDRWVMRGLGFPTDSPSPQQYAFAERAIAEIAQKMGWEPHQAQAALWVSTKARWENVRGEAKALGLKKGWVRETVDRKGNRHIEVNAERQIVTDKIDPKTGKPMKVPNPEYARKEASYLRAWRKMAGAADLPGGKLEQSATNFADSLKRTTAYVTSETLPSAKSGILPGLHNAPYPVLAEYHQAKLRGIMRTLPDGTEVDAIAHEFGVLRTGEFDGPGYFTAEDVTSTRPGTTTEIASSLTPGVGISAIKSGKVTEGLVEPQARRQLDAYAFTRAYLLHQESVPWHRVFPAGGAKAEVPGNASGVSLGHVGTDEELLSLVDAFKEAAAELGGAEEGWAAGQAVFVYNPDGLHVLNLDFATHMSDVDFQRVSERAYEKAFPGKKYEPLRADKGTYIENDWGKNPNGEVLLDALAQVDTKDGRFRKALEKLKAELGPGLDDIDETFTRRYPQALDPGADWESARIRVAEEEPPPPVAIGGRR